MAEESFEDMEVAALLNEHFISIKVDKEERPDIDAVYMETCQMLTGSGGWPLTIIMASDQIPFFAATYIPKNARYGSFGLVDLLTAIHDQWLSDQAGLLVSGNKIYKHLLDRNQHQKSAGQPSMEMLRLGISQLKENFDSEYGGFHAAPKFPMPHDLLFLLEYGNLEADDDCIIMAEKTLQQMYRGGIYDHIGGGFSRYSTDQQWLIPHFEKMLYDNALLIFTYAQAYEITGKNLYREVAGQTIGYAAKELRDEYGGFYCGQDADSDGEEGKYYALSIEEIQVLLGNDAEAFCSWYDITPGGNFEGKNIPNMIHNSSFETIPDAIQKSAEKVDQYRRQRTVLSTDDKVLVSWNAMMIAALAKSARAFENPEYLKMAKETCRFIDTHLQNAAGRLHKLWRRGEAAGSAQLDDYAYYAWALIEVYETGGEVGYLERALACGAEMIALFWDKENDGFFLYAHDAEQLIIRPKEIYDGAIPSGNSVAAYVLHKLYRFTAMNSWQEYAEKQLAFMAGKVGAYPMGHCFALHAFLRVLHQGADLLCASKQIPSMSEVRSFMKEQRIFNTTVTVKSEEQMRRLNNLAPYTVEYPIPESGTAYYICENGTCKAPIFR